MREKIDSYMGFARKAGALVVGQGTCTTAIEKGQLAFLLISEDTAENTKKKLISLAEERGLTYRIFGHSERWSAITGLGGTAIYGVKDKKFAETMIKEIDSYNRLDVEDDIDNPLIDKEVFG